jgi:hypothetical protein
MKRVQRKRKEKLPDGCKYIGRISKFGNPYRVKQDASSGKWYVEKVSFYHNRRSVRFDEFDTREEAIGFAIEKFRDHLESGIPARKLYEMIKELMQYDSIACWCKEGDPCHGDVWIELIKEIGPNLKEES